MDLARRGRQQPLSKWPAKLLLMVALLIVITTACFAAEGGTGAYLPGYRTFLTGAFPYQTGLTIRDDLLVYSGTAPRVVLNGRPIENTSLDVVANILDVSYAFPEKLFGATRAIVLTQPLIRAELSGRIIGTDISPSDTRTALGDTVIAPIYLGWHTEKLHYNANLTVFIPTAGYDINRVVNVGRNHWTLDPQFGITHFDPRTGWDFSGALGYSINFENPATNYKSGNVLHLDYAVGKVLPKGAKAGIVGYAWVQVTDDSGAGAIFGSFKSRVYGIGPSVQWKPGKRTELRFRYFHEFGAKNHLEGSQAVLSLRRQF